AGRIGGIGPCGREICCSTWMHKFVSVTTNSARYQEISLNPQKLAGQCGKLKCCLNFELATYMDAQRDFPSNNIPLETENGLYYFIKADIYMGENSSGLIMSPKYGAHLQIFNSIGKFDLYNQLGYRSNYDSYGVYIKPTFDYSAAVKYRVTKDLSIGVKGENIFGTGYKQSYPGLPYAMPIFDRKIWLNMEYLF
ncbi:MAG: hypothetical protein L3J42_00270, partial [Hydrogenimonas sp.]|nr:hypothetical protein [Hydrogenimonas sp.]